MPRRVSTSAATAPIPTPAATPAAPTPPVPETEYLSFERVRALFGVSPNTITRWVQLKKIPAPFMIGNRSFWHPAEMSAHLERNRVKV